MADHPDRTPSVSAEPVSRRQALKRLGGGLAAAVVVPHLDGPGDRLVGAPSQRLATSTAPPSIDAPRRFQHTATPLPDGRILMAGGRLERPHSSVSIFEPLSGRWSDVSPMGARRCQHAAALLPDGRVLVVGGFGDGPLSSAEVYDPLGDRWSPIASLNAPRYQHTAVALPGGQVLVMGGYRGGALSSMELYDPAADRWVQL